ncbi:MAG: S49 family peptidase [Nitrososphaerota archaeon]|nr:S49 family peptidase [Nitrososphaerota archaeon]
MELGRRLAASGGYYISLAADHIVVNPASTVGSVGAVGTLVSFKGLLDTLGIDVVTVKSGEYKDVGNSLREITETDVRFLRELVDAAFRQFAEVVRKTRDKLNPAHERDVFSSESLSRLKPAGDSVKRRRIGRRSTLLYALLTLITLGVFLLYWVWALNEDLSECERRSGDLLEFLPRV